MDICEECGRLFLTVQHTLFYVELEDHWGVWHQWVCASCLDDMAQDCYEGGQLVRVTTWGFELPGTG